MLAVAHASKVEWNKTILNRRDCGASLCIDAIGPVSMIWGDSGTSESYRDAEIN